MKSKFVKNDPASAKAASIRIATHGTDRVEYWPTTRGSAPCCAYSAKTFDIAMKYTLIVVKVATSIMAIAR